MGIYSTFSMFKLKFNFLAGGNNPKFVIMYYLRHRQYPHIYLDGT